MTDETPEQIIERALGDHLFDPDEYIPGAGRTQFCACGRNGEGVHTRHVAAVLTAELRANGWLVDLSIPPEPDRSILVCRWCRRP